MDIELTDDLGYELSRGHDGTGSTAGGTIAKVC
jgi:hypothetical protein